MASSRRSARWTRSAFVIGKRTSSDVQRNRVAIAPGQDDPACCNRQQRVYRLNLRPARARRLSEAGRHWAPIARLRATRKERHSGLTWPTYRDKSNRGRPSWTACAHCRPGRHRCTAETQHFRLRFFRRPQPRICMCPGFVRGAAGRSIPPSAKRTSTTMSSRSATKAERFPPRIV